MVFLVDAMTPLAPPPLLRLWAWANLYINEIVSWKIDYGLTTWLTPPSVASSTSELKEVKRGEEDGRSLIWKQLSELNSAICWLSSRNNKYLFNWIPPFMSPQMFKSKFTYPWKITYPLRFQLLVFHSSSAILEPQYGAEGDLLWTVLISRTLRNNSEHDWCFEYFFLPAFNLHLYDPKLVCKL